jgi:aspartate/methionine/tyrosine aminotransferase
MQFQASWRMLSAGKKYLVLQEEKINFFKKSGIKIINIGKGSPDKPTFKKIVKKAKIELENKNNYGYPSSGGTFDLKESIINFYKNEYGVVLSDDEVTVFSGSTAALTALPMALVNEGEVVLTPDPGFFGYHIGAAMSGAKEWKMPLTSSNNYLPDLDLIPIEIREKSKLMFLNYPHNPTGASATRKFFDKVVEFANKNNIAVIHDFAYGDIYFNKKSPSFLESKNSKKVGIEIYTFSKTFNMAGWRCAFAVGNSSIIDLLKQYVQNSVGGTFGVVQNAASFALLTQKLERKKMRELYEKRRNLVINKLKINNIEFYPPSGSFYVWLKLPIKFKDDKKFVEELLETTHVAVVPGSIFGENGKGFLRLSLVNDESTLKLGLDRLISFIKS